MKLFFLFLLAITTTKMTAQTSTQKLQGEYYLHGVMEVGSGFKFNADNSFDFFFMYGALDRIARGTWKQNGDTIILNSAKKPPRDFKLIQSKKTDAKDIVIKIVDRNEVLLRNVYGSVKSGENVYRGATDQSGIMNFEKCKVEQISLIHEFWPDRFSIFDIDDADKNYFEFGIEPWIVDIQFDNFVLILKNDTLTGTHPILEKKQYTYNKN
jgi:hypothetical protein